MKKWLTTVCLFLLMCVLSTGKVYAGSPSDTRRIAGNTRYQTSEEALKYQLSLSGQTQADVLFVALGTNYPDALSGAVLAAKMDAPILLYDPSNENSTLGLVNKYVKSNGRVYLLGGESVLSTAFENGLTTNGFEAKRLAGTDRYKTNICILQELESYLTGQSAKAEEAYKEMLFCSGAGFADALAASAVGKPIMILGDKLTADQISYLQEHPVAAGKIIGGPAAVSEDVAAELTGILGYEPGRIYGNTRYETAVAIAREFVNSGVRGSAVSCGSNFPDALCAGPILYKLGYPLILSDKGKSESGALYHNGKTIDHLLVFGGKTVLPDGNIEHLFTKNVPLNIATAPAKTHVLEAQIDRNNLDQYFQAYRINVGDAVYNRINGKSYVSNPHISLSSLRYLKVLHYNYEGEIQVGEIIVNSAIADRTLSIFKSFFLAHYQICQMRLIDDFWVPGRDGNVADDNSIDHNNTSSFNYRVVAGQTQLSRHALGLAIDINPLENPYVTYDGAGNPHVPHDITAEFVSYDKNGDPTFKSNPSINYIHWRSSSVPHVIMNNDYCDQVFKMSGFAWGGDWIVPKDFQHYEIPR